MGLLSHHEILKLHAAVVSARLAERRAALLVGIDPSLVAGLAYAATPSDQILQDLDALNAALVLEDGTRPLAAWLKNALALAPPRTEARVFADTLARIRSLVTNGSAREDAPATSAAPISFRLRVIDGPFAGRQFVFDSHDTFIFGRAADCHLPLPPNDKWASRYHFVLEANPPEARIRDLGSLNGTYVNSVKCGGRMRDETPEQGRRRRFPEVALHDRDRILVGDTNFEWIVELAPRTAATVYMPHASAGREAPAGDGHAEDATQAFPALGSPLGSLSRPQRAQVDVDAAKALLEMMGAEVSDRGLPAPRRFGAYEIIRPLARGGMGDVYLARHDAHGAEVALKIVLARIAVSVPARDAFLREVDVIQGLRHRNIANLIEHGAGGSGFWFAMELCRGGSVEQLVSRRGGKLPVREAVALVLEALDGLEFAHARGFVHRDLKPGNLLLGESDRGPVKIADFGLAKSFQSAGFSGFTVTGSAAGTPDYMPREQVINYKYAKPPSDVWSMAATLYFMLTGSPPREVHSGQDPLAAVLSSPAVPIRQRERGVPQGLAAVIDRCLAPDVSERPVDAAEMKRQIAAVG